MSIWFRNNDTRYKIFDNWNDEDDSNEAGLEVEDYKEIKNEAHDE